MKQVKYFEVIFKGKKKQHYTKDTEDYKNWLEVYEALEKAYGFKSEITYIAYSDGTFDGVA